MYIHNENNKSYYIVINLWNLQYTTYSFFGDIEQLTVSL